MAIYTVENTSAVGKPVQVYVNGNLYDSAVYADTDRGFIRYVPQPAKVIKDKDEIYTRIAKGEVTVEFI